MPGPENTQTSLIATTAALATVLVLAILVSSAYLRLTANDLPCASPTNCASSEETEPAAETTGRRIARLTHRLSASTVAVLALLITFIAWSGRVERTRRARMLSLVLICLTVFLAVLGAVTRSTYTPAITLGNVLGSNALAAIFFWFWLDSHRGPPVFDTRSTKPLAAIVIAVALICVVTLGIGAKVDVLFAVAYNLVATLLLLAGVGWLARTAAKHG